MSATTHRLELYPVPFAATPHSWREIPHGVILGEWLAENYENFRPGHPNLMFNQPLDAPVLSDVRIDYRPEGNAIQSILKPVFKLLGIQTAAPKARAQQTQDDIEIAAFEANEVKYGQVARESFGQMRIYPDWLVPRRRYFQDQVDHWMEMFLSVGYGDYDIPLSSVTFGRTPVISLSDGAYVRVYRPGEDLSNEPIARWWHSPSEVGATTTSGGLPLRTIYPAVPQAPDGLYLFSGKTVTAMAGQVFPSDWDVGMYLDLDYYHGYTASGNVLSGPFEGLQVTAGDRVELEGDYNGTFTVQNYTPPTGGSPGTASVWTASSAPSLEYADNPAQFVVNIGLISATIVVDQDYTSESALVAALNAALAETSLNGNVEFESGLVIREQAPYAAWRITVNDISGADRLFGSISAANTATFIGQAATSGSGARLTLAEFAADTTNVRLSIQKVGERFVITGVTSNLLTVERVDPDGQSDWLGWGAGFETIAATIYLGEDSSQGGWVGNYRGTPGNELCDAIEYDVMFPQGLRYTDSDGDFHARSVEVEVRYRSGPEAPWQYSRATYSGRTAKVIAFTTRVELSTPQRIWEIAMRRVNAEATHYKTTNKAEWFGVRTRIVGGRTSYPNFTTIAIRVKGSSAIGIEADEKLSVLATRILNGVPERRISKAVEYIARRIQVDHEELARLEETRWTPRGDTFDFSFEKPTTIKDAVRTALSVGFADFTVADGVLKPVRDELIPPELMFVYKQTFSARNTVKGSKIVTSYELRTDDETDCIDVQYLDARTWRVETVRCKEGDPLDPPRKVKKLTADGITDRDKAFQWGMRKLMDIKFDTLQHKWRTELAGLNCGYGSYVNLVKEIPGWSQTSRVRAVNGVTLAVIDRLDWQDGQEHAVALRRPDGTMSDLQVAERINERTIRVPQPWGFYVKPYETHVFFGPLTYFANQAIVREVRPSGMNVNLVAIGYTPEKYQYDNAEANN